MKRIINIMIIAAAVMFIFACNSVDKVTVTESRSNEPAGRIVIYTSMYGDIVQEMERALARQFPDTLIQFSYGGTGTLQFKLEQEIASGRLDCDILMVAEPSYSLELKERGILHPYISKEASALAFDYDPEGYWYPVRISNMVLAFNPLIHSRNSIPNSFYDFANDPGVSGAIAMSNPVVSGTSLAAITALRDKYGYEYFDALGRQGVHIDSGAVAMTKLETGEYKVIMVLEESILHKREEEGSRLEVIYPEDGSIVIPSTIMIVNERWSANRNIEVAQAITDWFLSPEGQRAVVAGWMHSTRSNFNMIPFDAIPTAEVQNNSIPVIWENVYREREEIRTNFEEYILYRRDR